jgi:sugar phosphate isomerase/epimerase
MTALPAAELSAYLAAVRELLDELNAESASGLITFRCAVLISSVDRQTRTLERAVSAAAKAANGPVTTAPGRPTGPQRPDGTYAAEPST